MMGNRDPEKASCPYLSCLMPCSTVFPLQFLQGLDPEVCIRWQVVDKRIPLYANHKELLQKASDLLGAYY